MSAPELLTAASRGAIAVLRVRGAYALAPLAAACGALPAPGELALRHLRGTHEELDEVLLVRTAEDVCEVHVHGAPVLVERVRQALGTAGELAPEDLAPPTRSGRPRGVEAAALDDLAHAVGEVGARMLLDQARGALRASLQRLLKASDRRRARGCAALVERARVADFLLRRRRVLLAGPPNAGKSTLFNLLVGSERALVSAQAGTTRDLIEAPAQLGPWPILAVDSAGLTVEGAAQRGSSAASSIDSLAEERARAELARADFVLWCDPGDGSAPPRAVACAIGVLATRADLSTRRRAGAIAALEDPRGALVRVESLYRACFALPERLPHRRAAVPFRSEQREAIAAWGAVSPRAIDAQWLGEPPRIEGPAGLL